MDLNTYQHYHEKKRHTVLEFPYNTYLCSIPLDFIQVPLHWHSELELIVIKKGHGNVTVDLESYTVSAGDIVFIRPGQLHSIEQQPHRSMEYENIIFKRELLSTDATDICTKQYLLPIMNGSIPTASIFTPAFAYYKEISDCFQQIDLLCDTRPEGYQLAIKSFLFRFFFLLVSNQNNDSNASSAAKTKTLEKLKTILKYVEQHYQESITIEDMSILTYYSKSHFMKFFKMHMGRSFIEYLNDYRLTMAEQMLRTSDYSILEIAGKNGFDNLSYFNRMFKRKYGFPPAKWRNTSSNA